MDQRAIIKARDKIKKMQRAIRSLKASKTPASKEAAWTDFIMAHGSFYSALEQGAKTSPKSIAWFGRKKHERKTDPLLRYLHFARNAEEHGIKRITGRESTRLMLKSRGDMVHLRSDGKKWIVEEQAGDVEFSNDVVALVRVHDDRFGDWCDPPDRHLGNAIDNPSPAHLTELALAHLKAVLKEAEELPR